MYRDLKIPPRRNLPRFPGPVKPPAHLHDKPAELQVSIIPTTMPDVKDYDPVVIAIIMEIAKEEGRAEEEARAAAEARAEMEKREAEALAEEQARKQARDDEQRRAEEEAREAEGRAEEDEAEGRAEEDEAEGRADEVAREEEPRTDELDMSSSETDGSPRVGSHRSPSPHRGVSKKCHNRRSHSPRSSKSPPEAAVPFAVHHNKKNRPEPAKYADVELRLSSYLNEHGKELTEKILKEDSFNVAIDFIEFRRRDIDLAYHICNEWRDQKMQNILTETAKNYLRKQFAENDHLREKFAAKNQIPDNDIPESLEIRISDARFYLPGMPNRVQDLKEFIEQNKSAPRKLFKGHKKFECEVTELNPCAKRVLQKVVGSVLKDHKEGRHRNGEWVIEDWDVNDGGASVTNTKSFYELKEVSWETQRCFIHEDLKCIASQIISKFALSDDKDQSLKTSSRPAQEARVKSNAQSAATSMKAAQGQSADRMKCQQQSAESSSQKEGAALDPPGTSQPLYPPYLSHLRSELADPMELLKADHFGWYHEYLTFHPAFLCCKARMSLIFGFYHVAVHLEYKERKDHNCVFADKGTFPDWTKPWYSLKGVKVHEFLWKVFWYRNYPDETVPTSQWAVLYDDTAGDLLEVVRHALEHVFLHSKEYFKSIVDEKSVLNRAQTITSDDEADLFVSVHFPFFLPDFIKLLFEHGKMEGEFADFWKLYKAANDV